MSIYSCTSNFIMSHFQWEMVFKYGTFVHQPKGQKKVDPNILNNFYSSQIQRGIKIDLAISATVCKNSYVWLTFKLVTGVANGCVYVCVCTHVCWRGTLPFIDSDLNIFFQHNQSRSLPSGLYRALAVHNFQKLLLFISLIFPNVLISNILFYIHPAQWHYNLLWHLNATAETVGS